MMNLKEITDVYLAVDPPAPAFQLQAMGIHSLLLALLPAEIAVLVLAEFIRNPISDFERLARALACSKAFTVEAAQIARLFEQHNLNRSSAAN